MFHAGAFVFGDTNSLKQAARIARATGFRPVLVDYPLADLPGAVSAARAAARKEGRGGRPVFAYGESAGGTLAALLGAGGLIDAGASYSQVTDLPAFVRAAPDPEVYAAFLRATPEEIRESSPDRTTIDVPFMALTGAEDLPGFAGETRRWARRNTSVSAHTVPGQHVGDELGTEDYRRNVRRELRWLARRARGRDESPPAGG